ncbi:MAG: carbamoyltransferase HypF [Myxococcota bacterium]
MQPAGHGEPSGRGTPTEGRRIRIAGTVQGVGFRPWVYRLARQEGLTGRVWNDPGGVTIEAFGEAGPLERFLARLAAEPPAAARIRELTAGPMRPEADPEFVIVPSRNGGARALSIPADIATCGECESELFDASDRRHGYAFTNCTSCGPRFTIATDVPYDRPATTMAPFAMCPDCNREYRDPADRRFHAQPNACPVCGPRLSFSFGAGADAPGADPIAAACEALTSGHIVAVKGLGGYHLACDATSPSAVATLRARKHRDQKPFAVMVRDLDAARELARLSPEEEALLTSPERPIVLAVRRADAPIDPGVAPDTDLLGLFLPYTPLHHLLLRAAGRPLVLTSANLAEEPICQHDDEARVRLGPIADAFLAHDREIATRCDDSVVRRIAGVPTVLRRSRGYVPRAVPLARSVDRPVLACGAHLKNTFCLAHGHSAHLGPHVGDLDTFEAVRFFEQAVERMERLLAIQPEIIAHDLHPDYASTRYALARPEPAKVAVQHHHAHVVSAMAEHGLEGPVLGVAYDGTGYGTDGTAWGGEVLLAQLDGFERIATFRAFALPGAEQAIRQPWRQALSLLEDAYEGDPPLEAIPLFRDRARGEVDVVRQMLRRGLNAPLVRGVGRYFDAIGALVLGRARASHEGQIAMAWNQAVDRAERGRYPFALEPVDGLPTADLRPLVRAVVDDLRAGRHAGCIAARFHHTLTVATAEMVRAGTRRHGRLPVVLTGGCFQNPVLAGGVRGALGGLDVRVHGEVPPGDGGIALGQALVADRSRAHMEGRRG